jgi:hypothetical protein
VTSSLPALPSALPSVTAQAAPGAANVFEAHLLQNGVSADLGPVTAPWIAWLSDQELVGIRADGAWGLQQNATSRLAAFNPSAYAGYSLQPTGRYLAAMTSGGDIAWYDLSVSTSTPAAPSPAPTAAAGFDCGLGSGPTPSPSVAVPAGPSLSWSADGGWAALALGAELWRVDAGGGATRKLADAGEGVAISGVAVSPDGQLVLFQESGCDQPPRLWLVSADGTGQRRIGASLPYSQLAWSPSGDRVAFARSGQVWLAQVSYGSLTQEQDDLAGARVALDAFMSARVAANPDQAGNYLSAAGRSAYGNGLGAPVGESFSRYTVIASQVTYDVHLDPSGHPSSSTPSVVAEVHELVRLVTSRVGLAHGTILEDVLVARIGDGYLVDGVTQDQEEPVDQSPQVNALTLEPRSSSSTQRRIDVAFDGELDPTSVQPQGFTVVDAGGQTLPTEVAYDSSTRTVSVTFDSPAAGPYVLQVQGVRDVNGAHTANLFSWRFSIFAAR